MTCARKILMSLALVILGLGFSSPSHALNIYEQVSDGSGTITKPSNQSILIGEFTTVDAFQVNGDTYIDFVGKDTDPFTCSAFNVSIHTDGGSAITNTGNIDLTSSFEAFHRPFVSTVNLTANTPYDVYLNASCNPGNAQILSNAASTSFTGWIGNDSATSTKIIQINTPYIGQISTSTSVVFDFDYFMNSADYGDYTLANVELTNLTAQANLLTSPLPILSSGNGKYRVQMTLPANNMFMFRPMLLGATSTLYGQFQTFYTVSNPSPSTLLNDPFATSTATSTEFQYLNIVSLLQNKHPIAYIPQTLSLLTSEATLSGTSTFPELTFDFTDSRLGSTTLGLTEVEMFSTSTITYFFGTAEIETFKSLITAVIWVATVSYLIADIRRTLLFAR